MNKKKLEDNGRRLLLTLDTAQLVPAGQRVNMERCQAVLGIGGTWGVRPALDVVERWAKGSMDGRETI